MPVTRSDSQRVKIHSWEQRHCNSESTQTGKCPARPHPCPACGQPSPPPRGGFELRRTLLRQSFAAPGRRCSHCPAGEMEQGRKARKSRGIREAGGQRRQGGKTPTRSGKVQRAAMGSQNPAQSKGSASPIPWHPMVKQRHPRGWESLGPWGTIH